MDKHIEENNFEPGVGGSSGALNYQTPVGTPFGGNNIQNPAHFSAYEKGVDHMNHDPSGSLEMPDLRPDSASLSKQVDQLFQKKITPSPDEIMMGLQYELQQMVKRDKNLAKQIVLGNLKKDPTYYSRLQMLNIDDDKMKVNETKKVLDQMIEESNVNVSSKNEQISYIIKDMINKKKERRYGKSE